MNSLEFDWMKNRPFFYVEETGTREGPREGGWWGEGGREGGREG